MRALALDFNGTLSDDEPVLARVYNELRPELTPELYFARWAGHTDEEILGPDPAVIAERIRRYNELVADGSTIALDTREAVRLAAARVPVALVSSAYRAEIEPVLAASGIGGLFRTIVSLDDVAEGKPAPEPYLLAAERLGVEPSALVAVEDTTVGVTAAKRAGAYVVGLTRTLGAARMGDADELAERVDVPLVERLLERRCS
ncbi:MAG TPA: HAD family phosphatase [Gaiellaceae bacterium]|jgi:beta-phosphoglucomutase